MKSKPDNCILCDQPVYAPVERCKYCHEPVHITCKDDHELICPENIEE